MPEKIFSETYIFQDTGEIEAMIDRGMLKIDTSGMLSQAMIEHSLQESLEGDINPEMELRRVLPPDILEMRLQERYELVYIIDAFKELLSHKIALIDNLVITDEEGYVVYVEAADPEIKKLIIPGCSLANSRVGTNAIGLSIEHWVPARLSNEEHYLQAFKFLLSAGIPIIKDNRLIGCAGFFLPAEQEKDRHVQTEILEFIIETAVTATSKMLETRRYLDELYLLKEFFNRLDNSYGMLLISEEDKILQVNTEAESLLGVDKKDLIGQSILRYLGKEWEILKEQAPDTPVHPVWFRTEHGQFGVVAHLHPLERQAGHIIGYNLQINSTVTRDSVSVKPDSYEFKDIIGRNKEFVRLIKLARAVAPSPSSVLITGESGTGKELFAQAIHNTSYCKDGPFVAINCAAIPRELMETELFGYVEGAFTGARRGGMQGKFLQANEGTLFLDEIGDMPLELQAKLLRVLQERVVVPVGGSRAIPVEFRLISATNRSLEELIQSGGFRTDLYYRLNVINLHIPPLRERKDDIEILARHFALVYAIKLGKGTVSISSEALEMMQNYNWPGNIRELENVIEMAVNLCADMIEVKHLGQGIPSNNRFNTVDEEDEPVLSLEEIEKRQIIKALIYFSGNISQTANALEIGRTTLYRKIKKYDLFDYVKQ